MNETVSAIYKNGTLVLDKPLEVSEGAKVEVKIFKGKSKKRTSAEILGELAALPIEGKTDAFAGRSHDEIIYGKNRK